MNVIKTSEYSIECDICGSIADTNTLDADFIKSGSPKKYFIKKGWREKDGVTICPECLKSGVMAEVRSGIWD